MVSEFHISFHRDEPPARSYPNGYWVAQTNDGNYDGVGGSPEDAMAALINVLVREAERQEVKHGEG